jgi:hypothetical protein
MNELEGQYSDTKRKVNKALLLIALFASSLLGEVCAKEIQGEVFIVTRAHQTVRLALVPTSVYPRDQVESVIKSVDSELSEERKKIPPLQKSLESASGHVEEAAVKLSANPEGDDGRRAMELVTELALLTARASQRADFVLGSGPYFKKLSELRPVATAKTDADGKFRVEIPDSGEFALVAYSEREAVGETENYFWIVPALERTDLTNENLTSSTNEASLLHVTSDSGINPSISAEEIKTQLRDIVARYADLFRKHGADVGPKTITLTKPVVFQSARGWTSLGPGTQLEFVSKEGENVRVRYKNEDRLVPVSSTDLK